MGLELSGLENAPFVFGAAMILSGVAMLVLLLALFNVWRRPSLPSVAYGSISLSERRVRWIWTLVLSGGLGLAATEDPVVMRTTTIEGLSEETAGEQRVSSVQLPLPFYQYERHRTRQNGVLLAELKTESVVIPWSLLAAFLSYLLLVVRWDPTNRWALRILHGRKRRRARAV